MRRLLPAVAARGLHEWNTPRPVGVSVRGSRSRQSQSGLFAEARKEGQLSLLLIGAGFNVDAAREVGLIDCGYPLVANVACLCFGLDQAPTNRSIEELFSEAAETGNHDPLRRLSERLMEADCRLAYSLSSSDAANCYRDFFQAFDGANFITFNYDSLPEILLHHRQRWYPHDGYGVPVRVEYQGINELACSNSTSLVLHLHGSFCLWATEFETQEESGERLTWIIPLDRPRYKFDPLSISVCFRAYKRPFPSLGFVPIEERIIAPVRDKTEGLKKAFVEEIYSKALSLVRASGTLIAVGYSFSPYDRASYHPLLEQLSKSQERKLFIVSPDSTQVAEMIAAEYPRLQVRPIAKTFKRWAIDLFRL
jgi:hypothetical protein